MKLNKERNLKPLVHITLNKPQNKWKALAFLLEWCVKRTFSPQTFEDFFFSPTRMFSIPRIKCKMMFRFCWWLYFIVLTLLSQEIPALCWHGAALQTVLMHFCWLSSILCLQFKTITPPVSQWHAGTGWSFLRVQVTYWLKMWTHTHRCIPA